MPRYRQGSISLFALLPTRWDQGSRMPQNMEIKIVGWSGNSANEGLNLGAGMQQRFDSNRRQRSGEDWGFHGACCCRRKQFRKLGVTNLLALAVVWEQGLRILQFLCCSHFTIKRNPLQYLVLHHQGLICLAFSDVWPWFRPTACQVCSLSISKKTVITGLVFWEVWHGHLACISWRDPCLGHCHCQCCTGLQWDDILSKWIKLEENDQIWLFNCWPPPKNG